MPVDREHYDTNKQSPILVHCCSVRGGRIKQCLTRSITLQVFTLGKIFRNSCLKIKYDPNSTLFFIIMQLNFLQINLVGAHNTQHKSLQVKLIH